MNYVIVSYRGEDGSEYQMCLQCLGPKTVVGMVEDILSGVVDNESEIVKIEIGPEMKGGHLGPAKMEIIGT